MVSPGYLAAVAVALTGFVLLVLAHTQAGWAWGTVIGPVVIALAIAVGMVSGGVSHPWALVLIPFSAAILLLLVDHFNLGGANAWGI